MKNEVSDQLDQDATIVTSGYEMVCPELRRVGKPAVGPCESAKGEVGLILLS